jgi:alcohol dehydrogenase (cytochrome c)
VRLGDNLCSDCVVALDADTGKLKWYYQFTPHDTMDYDSTPVPVLADVEWKGAPRKVMLWANRNGVFNVLDRITGQFLMGKPFVNTTWLTGFDDKGHPIRTPGQQDSATPVLVQPNGLGGTNWYPPSYSPHTGLFYIPGWESSGAMVAKNNGFGRATSDTPMAQTNLFINRKNEMEGFGIVRAFDPKTGEKKWEHKMTDITWAGVLSTASDLVFSGGREGYFYALDAKTGNLLWKQNLGGQVNSGPMTYSIGGRQYITVAASHCPTFWPTPSRAPTRCPKPSLTASFSTCCWITLGGSRERPCRGSKLYCFYSHGRSLVKVRCSLSGWSVWKYFLYAETQSRAISCWAAARSSFPPQTI